MTSTAVLVTVVLAAFATMGTATYALAARIGTQVDRIDRLAEQMAAGFERRDARMDRLVDELGAMRAAVAGLDARVATLEPRPAG